MVEEEGKLAKMVQRADIQLRNSYNVSEAAKIIGVSKKPVKRMIEEHEIIDDETRLGTLQSFLVRATVRVLHEELISFLQRGARVNCEKG